MKVQFVGQVGADYDGLSRAFFSRFGEGLCAQEVGGSVLFKLTPSGCVARASTNCARASARGLRWLHTQFASPRSARAPLHPSPPALCPTRTLPHPPPARAQVPRAALGGGAVRTRR